jgi:carbon monoxide dehydrogenase subunit G
MRVSGRATLAAPRAAVFEAICDPRTLLDVIPGCQEIERVSPEEYRGRIAIRLPAFAGTYDTLVRLTHADPPAHGELEGRVEGTAGTISGHASFRLAEVDGGTVIEYEGIATISGPLARLDSRFAEALARSLIDEGLERLGSRVQPIRVAT